MKNYYYVHSQGGEVIGTPGRLTGRFGMLAKPLQRHVDVHVILGRDRIAAHLPVCDRLEVTKLCRSQYERAAYGIAPRTGSLSSRAHLRHRARRSYLPGPTVECQRGAACS
jgi:hypothetical protein